MRKTKIICTLGPATSSQEKVEALIDAGMDGARLNFSHGSHEDHARSLALVRETSARLGKPVAVLLDLQGPKIRVGPLVGGEILLRAGEETIITTGAVDGTSERFSTDYDGLPKDVSPGDPVLLDDGMLSLEVLSKSTDEVRCRVVYGGTLKERKGINLPRSRVSLTAPTTKDLEDIEFAMRHDVDFVALSFVQCPEDVIRLREEMGKAAGGAPPIIAKIERPLAVENLDAVLEVSDGVMIARGDLGVELPPERVPAIQKLAVEKANAQGKLVIIATQMLDSMTRHPRPTRAEVSDVANAVLDGTDAVMLSGETAIGLYPIETTRTMSRIIAEMERSPPYEEGVVRRFLEQMPTFQNAAARSAVTAAADLGIGTIAAFTQTGYTAALISEYRPSARIVAFSPSEGARRRMALYWGVTSRSMERIDTTDEVFDAVSRSLLAEELCAPGEAVVIVAGVPPNQHLSTNLVKLHRL